MAQTVIGVFDSDPAAETAVEHLLAVGVDRKDIHIHTRPADIDAMERHGAEGDGTATFQHESLLDKVERFFATLVGDDSHPPEFYHYREVVRRGGALVSICVEDESQLPIVFTVFETSGARDIDEHAAQWKRELQEEEGMTSRGIPEPGGSGTGMSAASDPGARRQGYRVYPGMPAAPAEPSSASTVLSAQGDGKPPAGEPREH